MNNISIASGLNSNNSGIFGVIQPQVITDPSTPIGFTGWTYGQAVEELIDGGQPVDLNLFPFAKNWAGVVDSNPPSAENDFGMSPEAISALEQATGWKWDDIVDEKLLADAEGPSYIRAYH